MLSGLLYVRYFRNFRNQNCYDPDKTSEEIVSKLLNEVSIPLGSLVVASVSCCVTGSQSRVG